MRVQSCIGKRVLQVVLTVSAMFCVSSASSSATTTLSKASTESELYVFGTSYVGTEASLDNDTIQFSQLGTTLTITDTAGVSVDSEMTSCSSASSTVAHCTLSSSMQTISVSPHDGSDSVTFDSSVTAPTYTSFFGDATFYGGSGADTVQLISRNNTVSTADGDDTIYLYGTHSETATISCGGGADTIYVYDARGSETIDPDCETRIDAREEQIGIPDPGPVSPTYYSGVTSAPATTPTPAVTTSKVKVSVKLILPKCSAKLHREKRCRQAHAARTRWQTFRAEATLDPTENQAVGFYVRFTSKQKRGCYELAGHNGPVPKPL